MSPQALAIGSRRELFVDDALVASLCGGAALRLHQPVRREVVFETDAPWEGNACGYSSLLVLPPGVSPEDSRLRVYYHSLHYRHSGPAAQSLEAHPEYLCVIESADGLHWRRPQVGRCEVAGGTANNVVLVPEMVEMIGGSPAHTAVCYDSNPDCPPEARFKIVIVGSRPHGLYLLGSPDGYDFRLLSEQPISTDGALDSQNLMFWDAERGEYRLYYRDFRDGWQRCIKTAVSQDPLHFAGWQWLSYPGSAPQQLYTNQVAPYYRAPHLFVGTPARYQEREWSGPLFDLPGLEERLARAEAHERYGSTVTDTVFMASRDGLTFRRFDEAFIRPGPRRQQSWVYGDNYTLWGMAETPSALEDAPPEISLYASDGYWEGVSNSIRRYTLRLDGFVSLNAPLSGGELVTPPVTFEGGSLVLNCGSSGAGGLRVEIQDAEGQALEGYSLQDCPEIFGDTVRHLVAWRENRTDLRALSGRPVRLRFALRDADLYSFQFVPYEEGRPAPDLSKIKLPGQ